MDNKMKGICFAEFWIDKKNTSYFQMTAEIYVYLLVLACSYQSINLSAFFLYLS